MRSELIPKWVDECRPQFSRFKKSSRDVFFQSSLLTGIPSKPVLPNTEKKNLKEMKTVDAPLIPGGSTKYIQK